jgi:hypothetical protein
MDETTPNEPASDHRTTENTQVTVPVEASQEPPTVRVPARYVAGSAPVPPPPQAAGPGWTASTIDLTGPAADAARADHGYGAAVARPFRFRRRWWIAAAATIALIVVGGVVIAEVHSHQSSPSRAVTEYFDDLATGDTTAALALVDNSGAYSSGDNPLLSSGALHDSADRPSHLSVTGSTATTASDGRAATVIAISYQLGGTTVQQSITVLKTAGSGAPYLLKSPFIAVVVPATAGRSITVNGVPVDGEAARLLAYPAAYSAVAAGNQLIAATTGSAKYRSSGGKVEADISFPDAAPASGATAAVQSAVNNALATCAASTSATPSGCPFSYPDSSATLKWTITGNPKVRLKVDNGAVTFTAPGHPAQIHYEATTSVFFGLFPHTDSGTASADITGTARVTNGAVSVTFSS